MAVSNVITNVKRKNSLGSYDSPVFIGAEQRFVGALRQSNNNNLEEQSIMGLDCITTEYLDENLTRFIRKEFRSNESIETDYYILEIEIYNDADAPDAYYEETSETLVLGGQSDPVYSETFTDVQKETLSYVNKDKEIIIISTKIIQKKTINGVTTMKEVITNNL